jgi:hypothetical protein
MLTLQRRRIDLPTEIQPSANGRVMFRFPVREAGFTYEGIDLSFYTNAAGTAAASDAAIDNDVTRVEVLLNGESIMDMSGADVMDIMSYEKGLTVNAGVMPVRFGNPNARTAEGEIEPSLGTADVGSLQVILTFAAVPTIVFVKCKATCLPQSNCGQFGKWRKIVPTVNATGEYPVPIDLPASSSLSSLHIKNANIGRVRVEAGPDRVLDECKESLISQARDYDRVPNAAWTHIDYQVRGLAGDVLPLGVIATHYCDFTVNPAASVTMYAKTYEVFIPG